MLLLVTVNSADTDTHSYNSNLEFGLRVFNYYSCLAPRFQYECRDSHTKLIQYHTKKQGENGTETQLDSSNFH